MMKNPKFARNLLAACLAWYEHAKPDMGDRLNAIANRAMQMQEAPALPTVVCLCGSTKFKEQFVDANRSETLAGKIVLSVGFYGHEESLADFDAIKVGLDELHKRKIDLADEVLVLNVNGYVGSSTRSEIHYAILQGKPLRWLNLDQHGLPVLDVPSQLALDPDDLERIGLGRKSIGAEDC